MDFSNFMVKVMEHSISEPCVIPYVDGSKQISNCVQDVREKLQVKGEVEQFNSSYKFFDGRIGRVRVDNDDAEFKTDGVNSFSSIKKSSLRIGTRPQRFKKAPERAIQFQHNNKKLLC